MSLTKIMFIDFLECKDGPINRQTCEQRKQLCGEDRDFTNGCKKTCGICGTAGKFLWN